MTSRLVLQTRGGTRIETTIDDLLGADGRERVRVEANQWIKRLRLVPYGTDTMRTRFRYRDTSLWWFTEIYLHKRRNLDAAVATLLAITTAREVHDIVGLELASGDPATRGAAMACGRSLGLDVDVIGPPAPPSDERWASYLAGTLPRIAALRPPQRLRIGRPRVAAFIHAAFSRASDAGESRVQEQYVGPVLDALFAAAGPDEVACVQVGPYRNFRARAWWDPLVPRSTPVLPIERLASRGAMAGSHALWRLRDALGDALVSGDDVRDAARVNGVDLWPVLETELLAVARLQWPWATRAMDQAGAAFDILAPDVAVTYAEAGGWGRALVVEARRRGIRSVGLQHGFIYRHWLNYLHEDDELVPDGAGDAFPRPDRTLVFDGLAAAHLQTAGRFPADAIQITGNPRLDALAVALRRDREGARLDLRRRVGLGPDDPVAVLTVKQSELSDELDVLGQALADLPDVHLIVKPHPAETEAAYGSWAAGRPRTTVLSASTALAACLAAADVIVTRNSTVAIDGLVLGVPAIVMGLPSNLSPFVDAGVMRGASTAVQLRQALEGVLYDRQARERLVATGRAFAAAHQMNADGQAADRSRDAILPRHSSRTHA